MTLTSLDCQTGADGVFEKTFPSWGLWKRQDLTKAKAESRQGLPSNSIDKTVSGRYFGFQNLVSIM